MTSKIYIVVELNYDVDCCVSEHKVKAFCSFEKAKACVEECKQSDRANEFGLTYVIDELELVH